MPVTINNIIYETSYSDVNDRLKYPINQKLQYKREQRRIRFSYINRIDFIINGCYCLHKIEEMGFTNQINITVNIIYKKKN